ncbi:MAG: hypothetical protein SOY60_09955 [Fusobacterium gastrosuis]|uniref:hypothetical protein n=1 Tax=Fusobacterium TaxID=848 RepID=UPI001F4F31F4|nr:MULTISPECIES: hypothetical protein [Fusobacterium]MDD7391792.1 hypothetical protein [Fusobacteriaceae bacterium]MCI5724739.1 hypothetical protein [Fusobacterium sp.]MCI7223998.1 hypothetical protein [Fusobacterium sp.]MDD7410758.1 hypothetical protein [Fusobacteriaceae bacterium]MDY4011976.1 hypothetical protein [Fusobacterium gastrosuis]
MNNQLREEFNEFLKDKEEIREIIGRIGGSNNSQNKIISALFSVIVLVLLVTGIFLGEISLTTTLLLIIILAVFKIIWMLQQSSKSMHFQFWILNSLEIRINEIDKRQKKIEKLFEEINKNKVEQEK